MILVSFQFLSLLIWGPGIIQVVDRDGVSPVSIPVDITNNLFVAVWHRNHLGIISANAISEVDGAYSYDFTTSESQTYGTNTTKELVPNIWGMIAADGNSDGMIDNLDLENIWAPQSGEQGYKSGDFNMDAEVDNKDKNELLIPNEGKGSEVPE